MNYFVRFFALPGSVFFAATTAQVRAQDAPYPNEVSTHIGKLTFEQGIPTEATSKKLCFELDYHRAAQAYLWSLPIMGHSATPTLQLMIEAAQTPP